MINVTQTFLPPLEEYITVFKRAYDARWITNRGSLVLELESKLQSFLGVNQMIITNNGTTPLQIALRLLANQGEVITTPFSYVATSSAIVWDRSTPVFVDIDPEYLTIDETKIVEAITERTTAILATHVFGNPCNVEAIDRIAKLYNLKVIYDGAHCFGVKYKGSSLFNYGDVSTCSFHATKLFHTGEGGAMFTESHELFHKLYYSHNFGHDGPENFHGLGINGKISELQAAMGLALLPYLEQIMAERKRVYEHYEAELDLRDIQSIKIREGTLWNYSYFPILMPSENTLLKAQRELNQERIFPRRYFYPSLNKIPYINGPDMPVSENIASRILCLPMYPELQKPDQERICGIINKNIC